MQVEDEQDWTNEYPGESQIPAGTHDGSLSLTAEKLGYCGNKLSCAGQSANEEVRGDQPAPGACLDDGEAIVLLPSIRSELLVDAFSASASGPIPRCPITMSTILMGSQRVIAHGRPRSPANATAVARANAAMVARPVKTPLAARLDGRDGAAGRL